MKMDIKTLQTILYELFASDGQTIIHGKKAYSIHKDNTNHVAWVQWLPVEEYWTKSEEYNNSPVGWYALLRIA